MLPLVPLNEPSKAGKFIILLLFVFCSAPGSLFAGKNRFQLGVHAGVGMTRLYQASMLKNDFYFLPVPVLGVQGTYFISKRLFFSAECTYLPFRSQRDGLLPLNGVFFSKVYPIGSYAYYRQRVAINYVDLPLMISSSFGRKVKLFCGTGAFLGFCLGARSTTSGHSYIYRDTTGNIPELVTAFPLQSLDDSRTFLRELRTVNLGFCERIGIGYSIGKNALWLEARYTFGVTDIWKPGRSDVVNKTDLLSVTAAYTIAL